MQLLTIDTYLCNCRDEATKMNRIRIQKSEVTYDLGKFSVTNCARLPNYFKINLSYHF
jgi:hypothetical protein